MLKFLHQTNSLLAVLILLLLAYSVSCKKVPKNDTGGTTPPIDTTKTDTTKHSHIDLTTKVTSSISGIVETTQGAPGPLGGVTITFGNKTTITDESGYFEINDASVIAEAAQLTAFINGYYTHYKTFIASEDKGLFTIMKMDYQFGFGFTSASGGNFEGGDGERIIIPGNAVMSVATNTLYEGDANVYQKRIDQNNEDISFLEPGDSRGLDSAGYLKLLTTYGIGNFLLSGTNGQSLQLLPGHSATISIPLFGDGQPQSIALWHYDEKLGLWKQEGMAVKSDFHYVGKISKLGYWNFAVAKDCVNFTGRLVSASGEPIPYSFVNISQSPAVQNARPFWRITDANGYISGAVPVNSQLSFDIYGNMCDAPVFSKDFTTTESAVELRDISMPANNVVSVDARLTTCSGSPVSGGLLKMGLYHFPAGSDGKVHFNTVVCDFSLHQATGFVAEEISTLQKSSTLYTELLPGNNNLGDVSVCGTSDIVKVTFKLVDNAGKPLQNVFVKIAPVAYPQLASTSISASNGEVIQFAYENTASIITVYGSLNCVNSIYSVNFSTSNRDTALGNITISGLIMANVAGNVVDCNNNPVTSGRVILQKDEVNYEYPISNSGTFNFNISICSTTDPEPVTLIAENDATLLSGDPSNFSLIAGNNNAGTLKSCLNASSSQEFINYTIDADSYSLVPPVNSFNQSIDPASHWNYITGGNLVTGNPSVFFALTGNIAVGGAGVGMDEYDIFPNYGRYVTEPIDTVHVNITEYGAVGEFIAGNFKLNIVNLQDNSIHVSMCNFRVKRNQ